MIDAAGPRVGRTTAGGSNSDGRVGKMQLAVLVTKTCLMSNVKDGTSSESNALVVVDVTVAGVTV